MFSEIDLEAAAQQLGSTTKRFSFLVGSGLSYSASIKTGIEVADDLHRCCWPAATDAPGFILRSPLDRCS